MQSIQKQKETSASLIRRLLLPLIIMCIYRGQTMEMEVDSLIKDLKQDDGNI